MLFLSSFSLHDTICAFHSSTMESSGSRSIAKKYEIILSLPLYFFISKQKPMPFLEGYKNPCFWQQESYQEMCVNASRKQRADASLQEACRRSAPAEGVLTRLSCLPYFFLVGMPKSGSTDLMMRINAHPQAARVRKENHWFSRGRHTTGNQAPVSRNFLSVKR